MCTREFDRIVDEIERRIKTLDAATPADKPILVRTPGNQSGWMSVQYLR